MLQTRSTAPSRRRRPAAPMTALAALAALALAVAPAGVASAADDPAARDLTVEQTGIYSVQAPATAGDGGLKVVAWVDHADNIYAVGEKVRLFVRASKDAHVTVINVGPTGNTTLLFPNAFQKDNRVRANRTVEIPSPRSGASIRVSGPALGRELIKVIASSSPKALFPAARPAAGAPFAAVPDRALAVARDLQVAIDTQKGHEWDVYNKIVTTVARRSMAPAPLEPAPAGTAWPASGLRIATGKSRYRLGEPVSVYLASRTACYLTLVNVGTSGRMRVLLPNAAQPRNLLPAGRTVVFPGPKSGLRLTPVGPAGIETVTAFCTADNRPVLPSVLSYGRSGFAAPDGAAARDLAVVAAAMPARQAATATAGFLVTR